MPILGNGDMQIVVDINMRIVYDIIIRKKGALYMNEIGGRLRALREKAKLSQQGIADEISKYVGDTTQSSVNRYEMGKSTPPTKTLLWYADFFDVSMDYIYSRTDKPEGKLYKNEPKILMERAKNEADWNRFIEMCFDPASPMNARLKDTLKNMLKEGKRNEKSQDQP